MSTAKLSNKYEYKNRSYTRCIFSNNEYGFNGQYIHKDLGVCDVVVTQDSKENYYLMLNITKDGYEYNRQFECSCLPSYRLVSKKAREFLKELMEELEE